MAIVTLAEVKEQLAFTDDSGGTDDSLIFRKINAAQNHIERLLGFEIEANFGGAGQEEIPPVLIEAVSQLAAWWYEQREAASEGAKEVPFGVREIVAEYREFTF
jgi:hypothetical protein